MPPAMMAPRDPLDQLKKGWDEAGRIDPFWAVLSRPDKRGNRWDAQEFFETGIEEIEALMVHVGGLGVALTRGRALDFGCGPGRLTQALVSHFDQVDGVDISPSMIELADKLNRYPDRCHYHTNTETDLTVFGDSTFDFVYSWITLQHVGPTLAKKYLREFCRVIRPGGLLIFQLPGRKIGLRSTVGKLIPRAAMQQYRRVRFRDHPAAEMHGMPREETIRFMEDLGTEVLAVDSNQAAGDGWESFRYSCRRVGQSA
jgi:SAM-dependent methyltransferase